MIKKLLVFCTAVFTFAIVCNADVSADEIIGDLYRTDTIAYIDTYMIPVYSYNNIPYVVAEDLEGYGFNIKWKQAEQTLYVNYDMYKEYYPYDSVDYYTQKTKTGYVYDSGVTVKLDGETITSYSLDGRMLISLDELWRFGKVNWYDESRTISVTTRNFMAKNPDWETLLPASFCCERIDDSIYNMDDAYDLIDEFGYNEKIKDVSDLSESADYAFDICNKILNYIENDKYLYERGNLYHMAYNAKKYAEIYKEIAKYITNKTPKDIYKGEWIYTLYDRSVGYYNEMMTRYYTMGDTIYKYIDRDVVPERKLWSY